MSELRPRRRASQKVRRRRFIVAASACVAIIVGTVIGGVAFSAARGPSDGPADATGSSPTLVPTSTGTATEPAAAPADPAGAGGEAPAASPGDGFDMTAHSLTDPTSPWFIVNKIHRIPDAENFVPTLAEIPGDIPNPNGHSLHPDTVAALEAMATAAADEAGVSLVAQSGYRSFASQTSAFDYYSSELGVAGAELTSARPGFSEHQTGFGIDILDTDSGCSVEGPCFGDSAAGQWLAANAYRFGFILRYPADKTQVTGYEYEPWHFRYVGVALATEMHGRGVTTLEEFFGVPGSTTYG